MPPINITKPTEFTAWLERADKLFTAKTGLSIHDMEDAPWFDYFEDGLTPAQALTAARQEWFS